MELQSCTETVAHLQENKRLKIQKSTLRENWKASLLVVHMLTREGYKLISKLDEGYSQAQ